MNIAFFYRKKTITIFLQNNPRGELCPHKGTECSESAERSRFQPGGLPFVVAQDDSTSFSDCFVGIVSLECHQMRYFEAHKEP